MRRTLALLLAFAVVGAPLAAAAASPAAAARHDRIFYYRDGPKALASLKKNYRSIDTLAPQSYAIDGAGNLTGEPPKAALRLAKAKKIEVVPLVTNGAFDAGSVAAFLSDPDARGRAIDAMVAEAEARGYAGWQLDFEQMDASLKDDFTAFVAEAAAALHEADLTLSVAVVAKVSDDPGDYPNDLWQKLIGVYDYAALAQSADFLSIMSYDEPYKTGPVSPYPWLERVLDYALGEVPADKISLGVPLYYWEREDGGATRIMEIGGAAGVAEAKKAKGAKKGYDETMRTSYVRYKVGGEGRTLWYESAKSMQAKLDLASENGLGGISAWALGLEVPEVHRAFQKWK